MAVAENAQAAPVVQRESGTASFPDDTAVAKTIAVKNRDVTKMRFLYVKVRSSAGPNMSNAFRGLR
jgi:hypothetical protein